MKKTSTELLKDEELNFIFEKDKLKLENVVAVLVFRFRKSGESLRGGGCGSSYENTIDDKFSQKIDLPENFLFQLKSNCELLVNKSSMIVNDQSSLTSIMLAIQWFHYNSEYINVCCLKGDYVKQVFEIFMNQAESILRILPNYIRSQSFIAYRVLQIINELLRVVFSFQQKNNARQFDESKKESLIELVETIKSELEVESAEIWKTGIEYELILIEIMFHNCNINYQKGKELFTTFILQLISSAGSLSLTDGLIDSMLDGGKYLLHIGYEKVVYPKEVYFTYYYFQILKWKTIQAVRQQQSVKAQIKKIITQYQSVVENSGNWIIHYCWVQMICDILSYRVVIFKDSFIQNLSSIQRQQKWNFLIENNLIKIIPQHRNFGTIQLYSNQQFVDSNLTNLFEQKVGKYQLFCDSIMNEKFNQNIDLWNNYTSFTFKSTEGKKQLQDGAYLILHKIGLENLEKLKDELIKIYNQKQKYTNSLAQLIQNNLTQMDELDFNLYKDEFNTSRMKLWDCTIKLLYILGEIQEKSSLITKQIELAYNKQQEIGPNEKTIYNQIQENQSFVKNILKSFIFKILQLQIQCLRVEHSFHNQLIENKKDFKSTYYQNNETDQDDFNSLIQQVSNLMAQEKTLSQALFQFHSLQNKKNNNSNTIFPQVTIKYDNLVQILKELFEQYQFDIYSNQIFKPQQTESCNHNLDDYLLDVKMKIQFLQISLNLNRISQGKLYLILQNIEIVFNQQIQQEIPQNDENVLRNIVKSMLDTCKKLFQFSNQQEMNENQMSQRIKELSTILELNTSIIAQNNKQDMEDKELQQKDALSLITKLQKSILQYYVVPLNEKINHFQQLKEIIHSEFLVWCIEPISIIKIEAKNEKKQMNEQTIQNLQLCEKELLEIMEKLKQVLIHLKIEQTVKSKYQKNQNKYQTNVEQYSYLLNELTQKGQQENQKVKDIFTSFFQEVLTNKIDQNQQISQEDLIFILNSFCQPIDQSQFNIDQQYLDLVDVFEQKEQEKNGFWSQNDYKVRECLLINLMKVQACVQEDKIIKFVQWQIKQIWVKERDENVRRLLKNKDLLEMQRKLFSKDLKSFSSQVQHEMQIKLDNLSQLEQEIRQEGNEDMRKNLQKQLNLAYQEIDQYLENINDMSGQMNITLVFLKEIVKDIKSIKKKIDALQENVSQIANDVRKLRGKTYQELLQIRQKKVLQLAKQLEVDSVYVPLKTIEYDSKTGEKLNSLIGNERTYLLVEQYHDQSSKESLEGEVNEFLWGTKNQKDVLLLRGQAGSGKSRSAKKIEEFLWNIQRSGSKWIPIYVSLPSVKNPKFNLFEQAMDSDYYNFDSIQTKEFKEAIRMKNESIIFIFDSYDEMKLDCIQSNLIATNNFLIDFEIKDPGKFIKFIITTRSEILNSTNYKQWFCGSSLETLKDVELIKFDQEQIDDYFKKYVELSAKRKIKNLYEFIQQLNESDFDFNEFKQIWLLVENIVIECNTQDHRQQMLFENKEEEIIIKSLKSLKIFKNLKDEQIITLRKDLQQLWSSSMFKKTIQNVNIEQLLTTPFMVEIVVYVLPLMIKRSLDQIQLKEELSNKLYRVLKQSRKSNKLIKSYQNSTQSEKVQKERKIDQNQIDTNRIIDQLESKKFFLNYSPMDKIEVQDDKLIIQGLSYTLGTQADLVAISLKMKEYTMYQFYDCFIDLYHNQQIQKLSQLGKISNIESFQIDVFRFSQSLALDLTINQQIQINHKQKGKLKLNIFQESQQQINLWEDQYINDSEDNQEYMKLIRSCVLLTQKGSSFQFSHKSIQEFLVAKFIYDEISKVNLQENEQIQKNFENTLYSLFNKNEFNISKENYQGVITLLIPQLEYQNEIDEKLVYNVKLSVNEQFCRLASNCIYLLSQRNTFLGGMNFQKIQIRDTNLFALSFFGSDLSNSSFDNVIIDSCNFNFCNLNETKWKNIICKEMPYLKGHINSVLIVEFSKDGQFLASGGSDSLAIIWDITSYKEIIRINHKVNDKDVEINCVNFIEKSQKLITAGSNKIIKFYDISKLPEYSLLKLLSDHGEKLNKIIFSKDEQTMYSLDKTGCVIVWKVDNILTNSNFIFGAESNDILDIAITSDNNFFFAIENGPKLITSNDIKNKKRLNCIPYQNYQFFKLTLSHDNNFLALADIDGSIFIFKVSDKLQFELIFFEEIFIKIQDFCFSPDNQNLSILCDFIVISKHFNQKGLIYNEIEESFKCYDNELMEVSPFDDLLAITDYEKINFVDFQTFQIINTIKITEKQRIQSFQFSEDGFQFAIKHYFDIVFWDLLKFQKKFNVVQDQIRGNFFLSSDLQYLVVVNSKCYLIVSILNTMLKANLNIHTMEFLTKIEKLTVNLQSHFIGISSQNNLFVIYLDDCQNSVKAKFNFNSIITCINFSYSGVYFLIGQADGNILVGQDLDANPIQFVNSIEPPERLEISIDDKVIGVQTKNRIFLWKLESKELLYSESCSSFRICFSPHNQVFAFSSSKDIFFLNYDTQQKYIIQSHKEQAIDFAFSPDNSSFISIGQDEQIILQNLSTQEISITQLLENNEFQSIQYIDSRTILTANQLYLRI